MYFRASSMTECSFHRNCLPTPLQKKRSLRDPPYLHGFTTNSSRGLSLVFRPIKFPGTTLDRSTGVIHSPWILQTFRVQTIRFFPPTNTRTILLTVRYQIGLTIITRSHSFSMDSHGPAVYISQITFCGNSYNATREVVYVSDMRYMTFPQYLEESNFGRNHPGGLAFQLLP